MSEIDLKRAEKAKQVEELKQKFGSATVAILTEYSGLSVADMTELRRQLRSAGAELRVVKNTLATRAAEGTSISALRPAFQGPIAVALGYADPVAPTKVVKDFSDNKERLKIKMAIIEGRVVDSNRIKYVAQLPKREVLVANVVTQLQAPLAGFVWCLEGLLQQLVGTLEAVREKKTSTPS